MFRVVPRLLQIAAFCIALGWGLSFGLSPSQAADAVVAPLSKHVTVKPAGKATPHPDVAFGCKRIWRCDAQVCEWRRGCWGIYGYMEGPYYSLNLAQRQWERDGWPAPRSYRDR
jgi:hypothetical protein